MLIAGEDLGEGVAHLETAVEGPGLVALGAERAVARAVLRCW